MDKSDAGGAAAYFGQNREIGGTFKGYGNRGSMMTPGAGGLGPKDAGRFGSLKTPSATTDMPKFNLGEKADGKNQPATATNAGRDKTKGDEKDKDGKKR